MKLVRRFFLIMSVSAPLLAGGAITVINTAAGSESTATAAAASKALGMTPSMIQPMTTRSAETATSVAKGLIPPPREQVPGKHEKIGVAALFVPDYYKPEPDGNITLVLFFHGASWCSEQGFYHARRNAVLASVSIPNYGYPGFVNDAANLQGLIQGTEEFLKKEKLASGEVKRIVLASFSGGWTGVDAVLRTEQWSPLVTGVLLADSFYPRRAGKTEIDPTMAKPIVDFAGRAANAATNEPPFMVFTYLFPPKVEHRDNTTNRAAEYVATQVGIQWKDADATSTRGMKYGRRADAGNLHLIGIEGMTTQDHFEHFYSWEDLLKLSGIPAAK